MNFNQAYENFALPETNKWGPLNMEGWPVGEHYFQGRIVSGLAPLFHWRFGRFTECSWWVCSAGFCWRMIRKGIKKWPEPNVLRSRVKVSGISAEVSRIACLDIKASKLQITNSGQTIKLNLAVGKCCCHLPQYCLLFINDFMKPP